MAHIERKAGKLYVVVKRVTVDLEEPLYKRLRVAAAYASESMADLIRRLLDRELPDVDQDREVTG